jgi:autotransporter-associated beta strand protein
LLLVKSLDGQLPQIRLDATSSSPTANFAFQIENTLQLLDDLEIVGEGTQQFVINGNIRDYFEPRSVIKKGASSVTLGGVNTFGGTLTVNGGELKLSGSGASITGASAIFINGTAKLILEDGTISTGALTTAAADSFEFLGGRLAVTSIVGSLENNGGRFAPGASPALTTISGGFLQNSGELEIELGGPTAGTQYDRLVINGSAELGGTLTILLINGYVPALGSAFEFLTAAGGVSGIFDDLLLPILGDGKAWTTRYEGTGVMLLVTVQGDYNGNGVVDAADYTTWRDSLGQSGTGLAADGNGDEMITMLDYNVWKSNFGQTALGGDSFTTRNVLGESPASGVAAVPEPTAFLMAVVAGLLIIMPSRRRRAAT